jgi:tetratricopeptide (TPR) repeat protein
MTNKLTIAFTRREAELYRSHGLLEEAHELYREVLDESTTVGSSLAISLQEKIGQLDKELTEVTELEIDLSDVVSEREMNILREGWGDAFSPSDISTCASALSSVGLYKAAIEEYGKLVRLNQPQAEFIDELTDCIVAVYAPEKIGDAVEAIVARYQPTEAQPTGLRIGITAALARRGLDQSGRSIQPLPDKAETSVRGSEVRIGHGADSTDGGLSIPAKAKRAARLIKIYLADLLTRLRVFIRRFYKV